MVTSAPPLLRSPPFPHVDPHVAAVSVTGRADAAPAEDLDTVIAAVREARVGGSFWGPPLPADRRRAVVLRAQSRADAMEMAQQALRLAEPGGVLACLPATRWARRAKRELTRRGLATWVGEVDPWSLLDRSTTLLARADDEFVALAALCNGTVLVREHGWAPLSADDTRARLHDVLLGRVRYRDPFVDTPASIGAAVAQLAAWRTTLDANRAIAAAAGIAWWKRTVMEQFLWTGRAVPLHFATSSSDAIVRARAAGGGIAVWPSRAPAGLTSDAAAAGVPLHQVEDGFVRSVGLGVNLHQPFSVVVDAKGIHYDPSRPSNLERILSDAAFSDGLIARAEALRATILRERISKYGAGAASDVTLAPRDGRRRILVAGQVEDDQSVKLGGADVRGNLDLLARARNAEPGAEIWFRPHPDVDSGHRRGMVPDADALRFADHVVREGSMASVLDHVDGVHVLTSLTGFEALMRGLDVTTHGHPFFAGWGLTRDLAPAIERRTRRLTLAQLVAGTLILYPRYLDPATGLPCPPEVLLQRFSKPGVVHATWLTRLRQLEGWLRRSLRQRVA